MAAISVIDVVRSKIEQHVTADFIEAIDREVSGEMDRAIEREIERPANRLLSGREAWDYLGACNAIGERVVLADVQRWSAFKWLWFLRRLPRRVLEGRYTTSRPYDLMLAETLSAASQAPPDPPHIIGSINFEISSDSLYAAVRLARGAAYLSDLHRDLRMAAKAVDFEFVSANPVPRSRETERQSSAMELYDRRNELSSRANLLPGAGTPIASDGYVDDAKSTFAFACHTTADVVVSIPLGQQRIPVDITASYGIKLATLDKLESLQAESAFLGLNWWRPEAPALLLLGRLIVPVLADAEYGFYNLCLTGYLLVDRSWMLSRIEPVYNDACADVCQVFGGRVALPPSAHDLIDYLADLTGSPWPLMPGPPIRFPHKGICIDPVNMFLRLNTSLEMPPTDGPLGNVRADAFEAAVQHEIDNSKWRPHAALAQYRGKQLRVNSRAITDIDAIGEKDGVLLVVSCKSILVGRDYDAGGHSQVRNARVIVEVGVKSWRSVTDLLTETPRGDNFDFSAYTSIVGVVCTPSVIFVESEEATQEVLPGLLAATSLPEFAQWLSTGS